MHGARATEKLAAALQLHRAGRLDEAEPLYREILESAPEEADAWHLWGMLAHERGRHADAVQRIEHAISLAADVPDYHNNLGTVHFARSDFPSAERACRRALRLLPSFVQAHNNLGNALLAQGRAAEALACYDEAARCDPNYPLAWRNAASACRQLGRLHDAVARCRRALQLDPQSGETLTFLGRLCQELDRWDDAVACYKRVVALRPNQANAHLLLGLAFRHLGQWAQAAQCLRQSLGLDPGNARLHNDLGELLWRLGDAAAAEHCFREALAVAPSLAAAHFNLGNVFRHQGRLDEAEASYRSALSRDCDSVPALTNLAITLSDQGRTGEARDLFQRARDLAPQDPRAHSHLLVVQQYLPGATPPLLRAAHAEWSRRHAAVPAFTRRERQSQPVPQALRIGLVSGDFRLHPVGFFLLGALRRLDRERFHVTCYGDQTAADGLTQAIRSCAAWKDVAALTDEQLFELIRRDSIDILVDLAGHTAPNRLLVFARKPAAVQVTWMGYVGTTGLETIDYLLSDHFHTPAGVDEHYVEKIRRLPRDYICYTPPPDSPAVSPLPALRTGHVTFGSFSNPAKLSDETLANWSEILRRVPSAALLLKYGGLDSRGATTRILDRFALHGVDRSRLQLEPGVPPLELLKHYGRVDIALDTHPYSGGLTTCEALWMGVPVITFPGTTFAGRHAFSHLSNAGLAEFIAPASPGYVELAVRLAEDTGRLGELRSTLRERVATSPLCDASQFAADLQAALLEMWQGAMLGSG